MFVLSADSVGADELIDCVAARIGVFETVDIFNELAPKTLMLMVIAAANINPAQSNFFFILFAISFIIKLLQLSSFQYHRKVCIESIFTLRR